MEIWTMHCRPTAKLFCHIPKEDPYLRKMTIVFQKNAFPEAHSIYVCIIDLKKTDL